ncbi:hypothetical protein PVT67_07720 [Gallaecimonas kandeliae]|uniref:hypothetical protein n=1 Tax=Gallaecimonas kandeliae TaxID=3029055 RepID=UPI0026497CBB|nr:hypothetical protein [Gallaecimonas kandeliae]WKE67112.1 hypothetical protein PVT67_07720 [Gallaecimonas kandeliae]
MSRTQQLAERLLAWNRRHLVATVAISEQDIAQCFAESFVVKANGREYEADRATYLTFLNGFKSTIAAIDYQVQEYLCDEDRVVIVMGAKVRRLAGYLDAFEAMLLLKFDDRGLITLWQEVYVRR